MAEVIVFKISAGSVEARITPGSQKLGSRELGVFLEGGDSERHCSLVSFTKHISREPRESTKAKWQMGTNND